MDAVMDDCSLRNLPGTAEVYMCRSSSNIRKLILCHLQLDGKHIHLIIPQCSCSHTSLCFRQLLLHPSNTGRWVMGMEVCKEVSAPGFVFWILRDLV